MRAFVLICLLGCGSSPQATTTSDMTASATCQTASDCRLFSSYCSTAPCQCLPLGRDQPDPPCSGQSMSCFVDPCHNKQADCLVGRCAVR
jgi:hypothetical protein